MAGKLESWLQRQWYEGAPKSAALKPLASLFAKAAKGRREGFESGKKTSEKLSVPVIVVGNIAIGGTGKTPLVIAIAQWLQQQGYTPGIISRGYGGKAPSYPYRVAADSPAAHCGDEPLLIAQQGFAVAVDPKRPAAGKLLIADGVDILIADDGLQHYALQRDIEIAVVDAERGLGNGELLPAGPLREPPERLNSCDLIVSNGSAQPPLPGLVSTPVFQMQLKQSAPQHAASSAVEAWPYWQGKQVHAVAGIGNPSRYFRQLEAAGLQVIEHAFADHHAYQAHELNFGDGKPVLMTAKDAVKCRDFWQSNFYSVPVFAELPASFWELLTQQLPVRGERC